MEGPEDSKYLAKHDNPLAAPSLNPGEEYWVAPPTGKYRREKPANSKKTKTVRKCWTRRRVVPGPKAWRIIMCQKDIPDNLRGRYSTRPIVMDGPGYEIYEVVKPTPEALELIRQGKVRGAYVDRQGVIGTFYEVGADESIPAPDSYPGHSRKDAEHHFEQGD